MLSCTSGPTASLRQEWAQTGKLRNAKRSQYALGIVKIGSCGTHKFHLLPLWSRVAPAVAKSRSSVGGEFQPAAIARLTVLSFDWLKGSGLA